MSRENSPPLSVRIQDGERTTEAVVRAVATATERSELSIEPLYDAVDPDSLDALARSRSVRVAFSFAGCEVVVTDGRVDVHPDRSVDDVPE